MSSYCSIQGCGNSLQKVLQNEGRTITLHRIPNRPWEQERRQIWINFARPEGECDTWSPTYKFVICSDHFVDGIKGNHPQKANYNPTLRPPSNEISAQTRNPPNVSPTMHRRGKKLQKSMVQKAKVTVTSSGRRPIISIVEPSKILEPDEDLNHEDTISEVASSAKKISTEVNRRAFSINTSNTCLLCFRTGSNNRKHNSNPFEISKLFKMMMRFLNINVWQLCGLSDEVAFPQGKNVVDFFVTMCSECESVARQVRKLYPQFEKIEMQMNECCRMLQNGMESGRKIEDMNGYYRRKIREHPALVTPANVAEKIRNETRSKCSTRLKTSFPKLRITKEIYSPINLSAAAVSPELNRFTPASSFFTCADDNVHMSADVFDHQNEDLLDNDSSDGNDCIELLAVKKLSESAKPSSTYSQIPKSNPSTLPLRPVQKPCPLSKKKKLFVINDLQPKSSNVKILYSCYICKTKLPSKESIKDHFATYHSKNKESTQTSFGDSSADKIKANSKIVPQITLRKQYTNFKQCKICANGLLVDLLPHMVMTHGTSRFSKIIDPKWSDADVTNIVNRFIDSCKVSSKASAEFHLSCSLCKMGFKSKYSFDSHIINSHFFLLTDAVQTEAKRQIREMTAQYRKRIKDGKPLPNSSPPPSISPALLTPKLRNTCFQCVKDFETILELIKHRRMEHNLATIKCEMCDNEYLDKFAINFHRKTVHNVDVEAEKMMIAEKKKMMKMEEMNVMRMKREEAMQAKKLETMKANQEKRMKMMKEKVIKAAKMKVIKAARAKVKDIKKSVHKPQMCPFCSKWLRSKNSLEIHISTHSDKKEYCCDQCGRQFARHTSLKKHLFLHSGVKNKACNYCSKRFATRAGLTLHVRTHTNEKPYQCDQCGKAFAQKSSLNSHVKLHK